jgi:hypothetical protein
MKRFIFFAAAAVLFATAPVASLASAEDPQSQSAASVGRLRTLLDQLKLDAVAARDSQEPNRFVAAFYLPGSQLLVVSAPYAVPSLLEKKIAAGQYMEAYMDLFSVGDRAGHFFVVDMQADGLRQHVKLDEAFDSTSIEGAAPVAFDGKWDAQTLTEQGYDARFASDDARYARMLTVLIDALTHKTT